MTRQPIDAAIARVRAVYGKWRRDTPVARMRADWDEFFETSVDAEVAPVTADGVACEWVRPAGVRRDQAIVYWHGGGFQVGSIASHREMVTRLARAAGVQALNVGYRLAPEHPLPAALEDALAVVAWLERSGLSARTLAFAGDSAGALLAIAAMIARIQQGKAVPAAAYLMSAWIDLTASGESYQTRAELDPIHQRPMIRAMARTALGPGAAAPDPRLSPLSADAESLRALPPMLLQVGERETLVSDTEDFAARAKAAGGQAQVELWPGMIHVFQQFPEELPQAREAVAAGGKFLATHLDAM